MYLTKIVAINTTKKGVRAFKVSKTASKPQIKALLKSLFNLESPDIRTSITKTGKKVFKKVYLLN